MPRRSRNPLLPGTYTVTMKVDGKEFKETIRVVSDPLNRVATPQK